MSPLHQSPSSSNRCPRGVRRSARLDGRRPHCCRHETQTISPPSSPSLPRPTCSSTRPLSLLKTMTISSSSTSPLSSGPPRKKPRGRVAKLPKMNNSERGKYYRRKYKEYEIGLEASVTKLHKQVHDLQVFLQIREELAYRNPYDRCEAIIPRIFEYFVSAREGVRIDASFATASMPLQQSPIIASMVSIASAQAGSAPSTALNDCLQNDENPGRPWGQSALYHTFLYFDLVSFHVEGGDASPIVILEGNLHAQYSRSMIESLFPHALGKQALLELLLDKEIKYPCTYHFYFTGDGTLHNKLVEADFVHGLQQVLGRLEDVMWLLDGSHRLRRRQNSLEDIVRGPSTMALEFILS